MNALKSAISNWDNRAPGVPACFRSPKEWTEWLACEELAHTKPRKFPCRDCTAEYKNKCVADGTCVQHDVVDIVKIMKG